MENKQNHQSDDVIDVKPVRVESQRQAAGVPDMTEEQRRNYMYVIYGLFAAGIFTGGLAVFIGAVIAYAKREDMAGTIYADHISFLIKTFWVSLAGFVICSILMLVLIGFWLMPLVGIWYVFRVVVGIIRLLDNRTVTPDGWLM